MEAIVPVHVSDLLQTMPQLNMAITNIVDDDIVGQEPNDPTEKSTDPLLLMMGIRRKPAVVKMEIM